MSVVQNSITLALPPSRYWNYRLIKFPYSNAADPDAYYIQLCEVHYTNDEPSFYAEASVPIVESLDEEYGPIQEAINKQFISFTEQMLRAVQKPVLPVSIFEK